MQNQRWKVKAGKAAVIPPAGFIVLPVLALAVLSGCGNNTADTGSASPAPQTAVVVAAASPAPTATPPVSDTNAGPGGATGANAALAETINTKIVRNTQMTGSRITAVVDNAGVATLNGFVQNQQQKALAAKAAQETTGVTGIKNKLEIRPTGGTGKTPRPTPAAPVTNIIVMPGGTGTSKPAASPATTATPAPGTTDPSAPAATPTPDPNTPPAGGGNTAPGKPQ